LCSSNQSSLSIQTVEVYDADLYDTAEALAAQKQPVKNIMLDLSFHSPRDTARELLDTGIPSH
jgi:hypothetical protein